jgi:hypothetical protein
MTSICAGVFYGLVYFADQNDKRINRKIKRHEKMIIVVGTSVSHCNRRNERDCKRQHLQ